MAPGWVDVHTHYDGQVSWDSLISPVVLARRHHRGDGQLRRGLRPGAARPPRVARRADGGRGGHPRHRAARGHHLGVGDLPRVPRRARRHPEGHRHRRPGAPRRAARATSWATAAPTTPRSRPPTRSTAWAASWPRASRPARSASPPRAPWTTSRSTAAYTPRLTATSDELLGIARAIGATGKGVFEVVADLDDLAERVRHPALDGRDRPPTAVDHHAAAGRASRSTPTAGSSSWSPRPTATASRSAARWRPGRSGCC